uniref:RING-type domain-containing protein n=1 Tax=Crocodylus porosus TaxID=8502 RepID=A0A7M4FYJ5_CROPO
MFQATSKRTGSKHYFLIVHISVHKASLQERRDFVFTTSVDLVLKHGGKDPHSILIIVKYVRRYQYWRTRRKQLNEEQRKDLSTNRFNRGVKYTECAICLEPYKKGDLLKILSCSHGYHSKCIDLWHFIQSRNKTCPFCGLNSTALTSYQGAS